MSASPNDTPPSDQTDRTVTGDPGAGSIRSYATGTAAGKRAVSPGVVDVCTRVWDSTDQLGPHLAGRLRDASAVPWERVDASPEAYDAAMQTVRHAVIHGLESRLLGASTLSPKRVAEYVARQPRKLLGFAGIDPTDPACFDALDEAIALGLVGVTVSPAGQGFHPSHSRAMRLYERCQAAGMPVYFEPGSMLDRRAMMEFDPPHLLDEPARAFPDLRMVVGQSGFPWVAETLVLVGKHRHVYTDLTGVTGYALRLYNVLSEAHQLGVMDKLLFGSGFPFGTPEQAIVAIYSVNTLTHGTPFPTVPRESLRGIVERDTLSCLGIQAPSPAHQGDTAGQQHTPLPADQDESPPQREPQPADDASDMTSAESSSDAPSQATPQIRVTAQPAATEQPAI